MGLKVTHAGSLPRSKAILDGLGAEASIADLPGEVIDAAVEDVVRRQVECGVDVVSDGEMGREGFSVYVRHRLSGFDGETHFRFIPRDLVEFPGFAQRSVDDPSLRHTGVPSCTGPIGVSAPEAVGADVTRLNRAIERHRAGREGLTGFMSAPSPGVIALYFKDEYYGDGEAYVNAIAAAMRHEYAAILAAGLDLQIDAPDLAMGRHVQFADRPLEEFLDSARVNLAALERALEGLPSARVRLHVCWGNYEGPHIHDVEFEDIAELVLAASPRTLVLEGANPRHGHDWAVLERLGWPDGKRLVAGVIDTSTNYVEHPALVAERLTRLQAIVGDGNLVAGTDCGFGTFAGHAQVHPKIVWAKLSALAEGAHRVGVPAADTARGTA